LFRVSDIRSWAAMQRYKGRILPTSAADDTDQALLTGRAHCLHISMVSHILASFSFPSNSSFTRLFSHDSHWTYAMRWGNYFISTLSHFLFYELQYTHLEKWDFVNTVMNFTVS